MIKRTILVVPDDSYGWPALQHVLGTLPIVGDIVVACSFGEAKDLSLAGIDVVISAAATDGEPVASFVGGLQASDRFSGQIYILTHRIPELDVVGLVRIGIDGILLWDDIPPGQVPGFL